MHGYCVQQCEAANLLITCCLGSADLFAGGRRAADGPATVTAWEAARDLAAPGVVSGGGLHLCCRMCPLQHVLANPSPRLQIPETAAEMIDTIPFLQFALIAPKLHAVSPVFQQSRTCDEAQR